MLSRTQMNSNDVVEKDQGKYPHLLSKPEKNNNTEKLKKYISRSNILYCYEYPDANYYRRRKSTDP